MFQSVCLQNLENFEYKKSHLFKFQIQVSEGNSNLSWAPLVSRRHRLTGSTGRPPTCPRGIVDSDRAPLVTTDRVHRLKSPLSAAAVHRRNEAIFLLSARSAVALLFKPRRASAPAPHCHR
jgi:hypothetical protein